MRWLACFVAIGMGLGFSSDGLGDRLPQCLQLWNEDAVFVCGTKTQVPGSKKLTESGELYYKPFAGSLENVHDVSMAVRTFSVLSKHFGFSMVEGIKVKVPLD